ncbi:MAG TPA: hypothetical protein PLT92_14975 [Ignavibacteriaceae bacterium]|nr:hypothetical protein [Ignavibacteriaceae bacterium]
MHNKKYRQVIEVLIESNSHDTCLWLSRFVKKQCDAWGFCVQYTEAKSARKGPVLNRDLLIYQEAYSDEILIFKESVRIICLNINALFKDGRVQFLERGIKPLNDF